MGFGRNPGIAHVPGEAFDADQVTPNCEQCGRDEYSCECEEDEDDAGAALVNRCPDCGSSYDGPTHFCPTCTDLHVAEGHERRDVERGDLSYGGVL